MPMNPDTFFDKLGNISPSEHKAVFASIKPKEDLLREVQLCKDQNKPLAEHLCLVKDNFDISGCPTNASSLFLENVRPGPHSEGPMVRKIKELGLTVAGKTQMNEFAYGLDGANPHFGNCPNPHLTGHCSGGSSSGSAWAVAKKWVPLAFGTDTGGSIRVPAAFCGLYGLRLTPNAWAQEGCFPLAPSYDSAGWFTRNLRDMIRYTAHLLGSFKTAADVRILNAIPDHPVLGPAVKKHFPNAASSPDITDSLVSKTNLKAYNVLQSKEALEIHGDWIDPYADQYDPDVRQRILRGRQWTRQEISESSQIALDVEAIFSKAFTQTDVILLPVSGEIASPSPMSPSQRSYLLSNTVPASLAKLPVLTIPVNSPKGSLGIQCIFPGKEWEAILFGMFAMLE